MTNASTPWRSRPRKPFPDGRLRQDRGAPHGRPGPRPMGGRAPRRRGGRSACRTNCVGRPRPRPARAALARSPREPRRERPRRSGRRTGRSRLDPRVSGQGGEPRRARRTHTKSGRVQRRESHDAARSARDSPAAPTTRPESSRSSQPAWAMHSTAELAAAASMPIASSQVGDLDRLAIAEQEREAGFPKQTGGIEGGQEGLHGRIVDRVDEYGKPYM